MRVLLVLFFLVLSVVPAKALDPSLISLFKGGCFDVKVYPKGCIKIKHGHIKFGLKVKYWFPIAIAEVTDTACDFGVGIPVVDQLLTPVEKICNQLPYIQGSSSQNPIDFSGARYQVHIYQLPPVLVAAAKQALMMSHFVPCFDLGIDDLLGVCTGCENIMRRALAPLEYAEGKLNALQSQLDKYTQSIRERFNSIVPDRIKELYGNGEGSDSGGESISDQIMNAYSSLSGLLPCFFSELVSPIWNVDTLSPDAYTVAPVINAVVSSGGIITEGACDISTTLLRKKAVELGFGGIDARFVCINNWGHGYPRVGIVRNPDPVVAENLALARFLHLFSRTFPILRNLDVYSVKFQMISPCKTGCYRLGDERVALFCRGLKMRSARHKTVYLIWKRFSCCDW